jgi:hypothetical protein
MNLNRFSQPKGLVGVVVHSAIRKTIFFFRHQNRESHDKLFGLNYIGKVITHDITCKTKQNEIF